MRYRTKAAAAMKLNISLLRQLVFRQRVGFFSDFIEAEKGLHCIGMFLVVYNVVQNQQTEFYPNFIEW